MFKMHQELLLKTFKNEISICKLIIKITGFIQAYDYEYK